ncbi:sulfite exporter TauE/SafE family protein [Photobacterium sp. CCB-ST2H9]|uniref:sulfite exporter TauE/SafE family protein n=1 Tax=unclassified Photobacterium TaxID=2628852 RepID=UPI00200303B6|nr:sulfite exporter TauE/SafE family protein [Photobacterium sp. CCB-ST2H9]UTM59834.1 sulfite exporter TauE/SafE family protein [Photobacterium sp. CCB-ST2H9]
MADFSVSMLSVLGLSSIAILTSVIAAILGFGGGMLLIAFMPLFLPAAAVIPVHGVTQMVSNVSRAVFSWREVAWYLLPAYFIGAATGTLLVGLTVVHLATNYLPLFIGSYILLNVWHKGFMGWISRFESMFMAGFVLSALGLLVGAPGPVFHPMVMKKLGNKHQLVATTAMMMTIAHGLKLLMFGWIGFAYLEQWPLLLVLMLSAILGSWLGTHVRRRTDDEMWIVAMKILLSALAVHMMISVATEL